MDLYSRVCDEEEFAMTFLDSLKEKAKYAEAITVRANSNFKLGNLKAVIADYNKAVSFW